MSKLKIEAKVGGAGKRHVILFLDRNITPYDDHSDHTAHRLRIDEGKTTFETETNLPIGLSYRVLATPGVDYVIKIYVDGKLISFQPGQLFRPSSSSPWFIVSKHGIVQE